MNGHAQTCSLPLAGLLLIDAPEAGKQKGERPSVVRDEEIEHHRVVPVEGRTQPIQEGHRIQHAVSPAFIFGCRCSAAAESSRLPS